MNSERPLVSVVIPNWNGRRFLSECLTALRNQTYGNIETIVVDNGSTDGSVEFMRSEFPEVRLVAHAKNLGFAEGTNTGIREAQGEWIATLNNDTAADSNWISELTGAVKRGRNVGMVASRMVFSSDPQTMNSAGIRFDFLGLGKDIGFGLPFGGDFKRPMDVFGPCAGAALYSSEMLKETGLFDSSFFAYFEDLDLAWRAQLRGWRCVYCPTAVVRHHFSGTSKPKSAFVRFHCQRNRMILMLRYEPFRYLLLASPVVLGELVKGYATKLSGGESAEYNGLREGLGRSFESLRFRNSILARAKARPLDLFKAYGRRKSHYVLEENAYAIPPEND